MFEWMNEQDVIQFSNLMVIYTSLAFPQHTHTHTHTHFCIPVSKFVLFCKAKPLNPSYKSGFSIGFWLMSFSESLTFDWFVQHTFQSDCTYICNMHWACIEIAMQNNCKFCFRGLFDFSNRIPIKWNFNWPAFNWVRMIVHNERPMLIDAVNGFQFNFPSF